MILSLCPELSFKTNKTAVRFWKAENPYVHEFHFQFTNMSVKWQHMYQFSLIEKKVFISLL